MAKYITKDKVLDFVTKMWDEGIKVDIDPKKNELCVNLGNGKYEWIQVYDNNTYNELIEFIIAQKEE